MVNLAMLVVSGISLVIAISIYLTLGVIAAAIYLAGTFVGSLFGLASAGAGN